MKRFVVFVIVSVYVIAAFAQTWRWYPGDMDIWMGNKINSLRTENGSFYPAFWRNDYHYQTVEFSREYNLDAPEEVELAVDGQQYGIKINKNYLFGMPAHFTIPKGRQTVRITVTNMQTPPAIWLKGTLLDNNGQPVVQSDSTWNVTNFITPVPTDTWTDMDGKPLFTSKDMKPSAYHLSSFDYRPIKTSSLPLMGESVAFVEWEQESMGYLKLIGVKGNGRVTIAYGESMAEAQDMKHSYLKDIVEFSSDSVFDLATGTVTRRQPDYVLHCSRAMHYATVQCDGQLSIDTVTMMKEMKKVPLRGSFVCNDTLLNHIWNVSAYTLQLTDREVMIEGIKRDRWIWSGDAIQSYLMNYYCFMDAPVVRRTIWALRGKDPVEQHINTILDYTFFWFNSVYDYYMYTGDSKFVKQIYPRMQTLMQWMEGRLDSQGMVQGKKGDWVFVDWSPKKMPKDGELAFEQMVYCRSLEAMALCADIVGNSADKQKYLAQGECLRAKLSPTFWNRDLHAFVHHVNEGGQDLLVTRYSNIFAVLYDYATSEQKQDILDCVLSPSLSESQVMEITTPYMRFYELEALCKLGQQSQVLKDMRSYWGGMLKEGATTFWETYDPTEPYPQRLAMYGHPFAKSLCHAWGASPIYLIGRYYLGVRPTKPGYAEWEAEPCLGDLKWMKGNVPTPHGNIYIEMQRNRITIEATGCGNGTLIVGNKHIPVESGKRQVIKIF